MNTDRIVLAGGSGFLGGLLARHFRGLGYGVVILGRNPGPAPAGVRVVGWNGRDPGPWARELEGAVAVVNLAGRSVDCRYHARNRREILASRLEPTRALGAAVAACANPPAVWLNAGTATVYRHTFGPAWDESGETGATPAARDAFSVEVARAWEQAFAECPAPATRKVALRTAMVLGDGRNSVFPVLRRLTRLGLGGPMAGGRQHVSWIHHADFCRAVAFLVATDGVHGPVNVAAPGPVTQAEMMAEFRRVLGVRFGLPAPRWMLEVGAFLLRTETELVLKSRRVVPARLVNAGFAFRYPRLREALEELVRPARPTMPAPRRAGESAVPAPPSRPGRSAQGSKPE